MTVVRFLAYLLVALFIIQHAGAMHLSRIATRRQTLKPSLTRITRRVHSQHPEDIPEDSQPATCKYFGPVIGQQRASSYSDFLLKVIKHTDYKVPVTTIDKALKPNGGRWSGLLGSQNVVITKYALAGTVGHYQYALYMDGKMVALYEGRHEHDPVTERLMH